MGFTLAEKILASHCERDSVKPGDYIITPIDLVLGNDISSSLAIKEFRRLGLKRVFDNERIALIPDHFVPNKDIASAEQGKMMREFAREFQIKHYYEVGRSGIEHVIVHEMGLVGPGDVVIGADSHTCTYGALGAFGTGMGSTDMLAAMVMGKIWMKVPESMKIVYKGKLPDNITGKDIILNTIGKIGIDGAMYKSVEFSGDVLSELSMDSRFTMSNMVVEAGAKCGIFTPDERTMEYVKLRAKRPYKVYKADSDAVYADMIEIDVTGMEPQIAFPHLPENVKPLSQVRSKPKIEIDQVFIGSCTNGRIEDLRIAAKILKGRRVHSNTRMIIIPGSQEIYKKALEEGLVSIFVDTGAVFSTPTCGPCLGGHMGLLASGERCVSTSNRNFRGRMGHPDSEIYLAGPYVAASTAVLGYLGGPEEVD